MVYSEGPKRGWSKKFPRFPLIRKLQSATHPANPYLQFLPRFKLERFQRSAFKSNRNPENSSGNRSKNPISYSCIISGGRKREREIPGNNSLDVPDVRDVNPYQRFGRRNGNHGRRLRRWTRLQAWMFMGPGIERWPCARLA